MYCVKCGAQIQLNDRFCSACGALTTEAVPMPKAVLTPQETWLPTEPPKAEKTPKGKTIFQKFDLLGFVSGFLVVGILLGIFFMTGKVRTHNIYEVGYDSAEDAAMAYLEGLRDGDVEKMLSSFVSETIDFRYVPYSLYDMRNLVYSKNLLSNCDGIGAIDWYAKGTQYIIQTYLALTQGVPGDYQLFYGFSNYNIETFEDQESAMLSTGYDFKHSSDGKGDLREFADILRDETWMEELSEMEIGRSLDPVDFYDGTETEYREFVERICQNNRWDGLQTVIIEVTLGGRDLYFVMDTICMDGKWFNYGTLISASYDFGEDYTVNDLFAIRR